MNRFNGFVALSKPLKRLIIFSALLFTQLKQGVNERFVYYLETCEPLAQVFLRFFPVDGSLESFLDPFFSFF